MSNFFTDTLLPKKYKLLQIHTVWEQNNQQNIFVQKAACTEHFMDLGKLNFLTVVQFWLRTIYTFASAASKNDA